jgi:hypothetical protein
MRYIVRLRRGRKYTDTNGNVIRDDWGDYTSREPVKAIPQNGELVLEYDNDVPRLKIGNGVTDFGSLEYMSIDSFILPKQKFVQLSTQWTQDPNHNDRYYQAVNVAGESITPKSKVDLHPTPEQLCEFQEKNLVFVAENSGGLVNVYCVGQIPEKAYRIPVTVTEVVTNDSVVIGNTTATPNYNPNWEQDDQTKADYIRNKPIILSEEDVLELIKNNGGAGGTGGGVDSLHTNISLYADRWVGDASPYSQVVTIDGVNDNSKVELFPNIEQLISMSEYGISLIAINENSVVTVYAFNNKPISDLNMQVTVSDVINLPNAEGVGF